MGFNVRIELIKDTYKLTYTNAIIKNENAIKKIEILHDAYDGYVYDIETEAGVFHAGIGNMILKNTDSIFCKFPLADAEGNNVYGKDALPYAIEIGQHVEKNIVKIMPKPQKLNYEKSLYPFILFSKKRYVGNLYETSVEKFKQKSMGIVLKRRDNAPIVKKIYGGIIDIILNKQDLRMSIEFLQEELDDLVNGKAPITDLVISKSLRASYKDPSKIAHKVLADRIGARDPGNRPVVNDRIPFVYIKTSNPNALQGDRIENPDYIVQNGLTPDYLHYITNQIMKPILQLYALCLDQLPGYDKDHQYWLDVEKALLEKPMYADDTRRKARIENLRLNMVKELLFDKFINILAEPKVRKKAPAKKPKTDTSQTEPVNTVTQAIICTDHAILNTKKTRAKKGTDNIDTNTITQPNNKGTIKVTKNLKSAKIVAEAYIVENGKKVWAYKNENAPDKDSEIIKIIQNMVAYKSSPTKYSITLNNAPFIKDYTICIAKYNELIAKGNNANNIDMLENMFNSHDTGKLQDISKMKKYKDLFEIKDRFEFELKTKN